MAKYILLTFIIINFISVYLAQDFEPLPLEDPDIKTTSKTAPNTTPTTKLNDSTDAPKNSNSEPTRKVNKTRKKQPSTDSPFSTLITTTTSKTTTTTTPESRITTTPRTTTTTTTTTTSTPPPPTILTTTTPQRTTSTESTTATTHVSLPRTTATPIPKGPNYTPHQRPTVWYPAYPSPPNFGGNQCYYKTQQGYPQAHWICGQLQYLTPIECYHCCRYANSFFAGCHKVHIDFCEDNNNWHDFMYRK